MYRVGNKIIPGDTAQTARDIKVNFILNESLSKTAFMSITLLGSLLGI